MSFSALPQSPHLLQTDSWGTFKSLYGWEPVRLHSEHNSVLVLFRKLPLGFSIAYIPKCSIASDWESLLSKIIEESKRCKAVFLQIEPDIDEPYDELSMDSLFAGFVKDEDTIQPRGTILLDISGEEDDILATMKQKTRYNIRLAERKGVKVTQSEDLVDFYKQMQVTAGRDGFALHSFDYYKNAWEIFAPKGECVLLRASFEDETLAYLMLFMHGKRAWYFYGASNDKQRNLMPTYLLQWEAIRTAKAHGATLYDLWGIPDANEEELESNFMERSDGLWGVYRFKRGFGGVVTRSAPAYIKVFNPLLYKAYLWLKKRRGGAGNESL